MSGKEIKKLREKVLGLNQAQFSELLSVSPRTLIRWENGQSQPRGALLKKLHQVESAATNPEVQKLLKKAIVTGYSPSAIWWIIGLSMAMMPIPLFGIVGGAAGGILGSLSGIFQMKDDKNKTDK